MADTFIDYDETRIYGDYAIEQVARLVVGRLREFNPALQFATTALRAERPTSWPGASTQPAAATPRSTRSWWRARRPCARPATSCSASRTTSSRTARAWCPWKRFFVDAPDTLSHRGPVRLLAALDHVLGTLDEHHGAVRDADHWRVELAAARAALDPWSRKTAPCAPTT